MIAWLDTKAGIAGRMHAVKVNRSPNSSSFNLRLVYKKLSKGAPLIYNELYNFSLNC